MMIVTIDEKKTKDKKIGVIRRILCPFTQFISRAKVVSRIVESYAKTTRVYVELAEKDTYQSKELLIFNKSHLCNVFFSSQFCLLAIRVKIH